jgi:hypothetical protein
MALIWKDLLEGDQLQGDESPVRETNPDSLGTAPKVDFGCTPGLKSGRSATFRSVEVGNDQTGCSNGF